jgi:hypothetical protein
MNPGEQIMSTALGFALVFGVVAGIVLLLRAIRVRLRVNLGISFADVREVSRDVHDRVGEYMRANYGGDVSQLAHAMRGLLPHVREIIHQHGKQLDDDVLRALLVTSIAAHRIATRTEAETALDEVLRTEHNAA